MRKANSFLGLSKAEILDENDKRITVKIPNRKEDLTVNIDRDVLDLLDKDSAALKQTVKNLVSRNSKNVTKETLNINKRNYFVFK